LFLVITSVPDVQRRLEGWGALSPAQGLLVGGWLRMEDKMVWLVSGLVC